MRHFLAGLSACLCACGDNRSGAPDASEMAVFQTAPHAPMPAVAAHTGIVLSDMQLVTITYDGYDRAAEVGAFGDALVHSSWYQAVGEEFGMTAAQHVQQVSLGPAPASLTRAQLAIDVQSLIARHDVVQPSEANNQVLYLVYVPPSVSFDAGLLRMTGYHEMLTLGNARFPLAVAIDAGAGLAPVTLQAAHQVIDAVTDPYVPPTDGYHTDPLDSDPWCLMYGEIADLCQGEDPYIDPDTRLRFPRVYSTAAAKAGNPPCLPSLDGEIWSDVSATPSQIQVVGPGDPISFTITGWSTAPTADWTLHLRTADGSQIPLEEMQPLLSSTTINNGQQVSLTLRAPRQTPPRTLGGVTLLSGDNLRPWAVGFIVK
jgi:hypothetical protein